MVCLFAIMALIVIWVELELGGGVFAKKVFFGRLGVVFYWFYDDGTKPIPRRVTPMA